MPSCIRAPPLVEMMMTGRSFSVAAFDQPRQFFAHDRTHRAAEKIEIHHAQPDAMLADFANAGDHRVLQRRVFLVGFKLGFVGGRAGEPSTSTLVMSASISSKVQVSTSEWMRSREPMGK